MVDRHWHPQNASEVSAPVATLGLSWATASAVLRTARFKCSLLTSSSPDQGSSIVILGSQVTIVILYPEFPRTPTTLLSLLKSQHQMRPPELMTFNENFNDCLCSAPCLSIHLLPDTFCLQTDASGVVGSVLPVTRDSREHPVAYCRRKWYAAQWNYSATELEGLAVVASIQHISVYLYVTHFTVETGKCAPSILIHLHANFTVVDWHSMGSTPPSF